MNRTRRPIPACPRCGSRDSIRIILNQPRPELPVRDRPARSLLERIGLGMDNPDRVCKRCGLQWRSRSMR
jgi:hypothetical protein